MAFKVNGVEPTEIKFVKNGVTTDLTVLKCGNTAVWGKPFTLTISQGTGVASVTVNRTSSPNQHASTGALSSGATIYYGDVLSVSATASTDYTINPYTSSYTVTDNVAVSISATQNASEQFTYEPVIVGEVTYDEQSAAYEFTYSVKNKNYIAVSATITEQYDSDSSGITNTYYKGIDGHSSYSCVCYRDEQTKRGVKITVTFSAMGYEDITTTATFGDYEGEDTSTTTTTTTE